MHTHAHAHVHVHTCARAHARPRPRARAHAQVNTIERDVFEARVGQLEAQLRRLQSARLDLHGHMDSEIGRSLSRQLELLRKQRDEAFHAREVAVDGLREGCLKER